MIQRRNIADLVGAGKAAVRDRHLAANDDLSLFAETAKQPAQSQRRADAVAVGLDVRRNSKLMFGFN